MYRVTLSRSLFPAVADPSIEKITIGDLLRRQASAHPDRISLKEIMAEQFQRDDHRPSEVPHLVPAGRG